jgi:hypothetical protein
MGRQLRIIREKTEKKAERVYQANEVLMTDPLDENTGVPSTWGLMLEQMVLFKMVKPNGDVMIVWRYK